MGQKNLILIVGLVGVLVLCSACSDQLDVTPTSVITANSFWETPDEVNAALQGMYVDLRSEAAKPLFFLGGARASDVYQDGTVGTNWHRYYTQTLIPTDAGPSWESFYKIVDDANLLIKYTPNINFSSKEKKNDALAQAYTMRAFIYFVMVRTWGDLVIRTEPTEGSKGLQKERSSQKDVFQLIKKDLDQALQLYPNDDFPSCRCEWSKPAAEALKGNVYLWTGKRLQGGKSDFQVALKSLEKVKNSDAKLLKDYADIFKYSNKGNQEVLMVSHFELHESGNNYYYQMFNANGNIPANATQATLDAIGTTGGFRNNIVNPTPYVRDSLWDDHDQRKNATYYNIYHRDTNGNKGDYYLSLAMKGKALISGGQLSFVNDVILYRYADVLLMIAETKNALGMDPSHEINLVRKRAYGKYFKPDHVFVSTTKKVNNKAILKERLREFATEGKRWWTLRRFGVAIDLPSMQSKPNPKHLLLFPISSSVLSLEPKIKQNPGY
jgi:hypothetical protein